MPRSSTSPGSICDAVAKGGFDGIMLDLHGAMVTESREDGEGELLRRIRAIDPTTPIAVSLDMHANLYDAIIDNATVVTGYRTYPHIDTYETAKRAGEILLAAMRGEVRPVMAWGNVPMLPHVMRQGSDDHPNQELQAPLRRDDGPRAQWRRARRQPVHRLSACRHQQCRAVGGGRDRRRQGARREAARRVARPGLGRARGVRLPARAARSNRSRAPRRMRAAAAGRGPDRACSTITTTAPRAARWTRPRCSPRSCAQGLENVAAFAIYDPQAVQQAIAAGIGAEVTLSVGGKIGDAGDPRPRAAPLTLTGAVKTISNGRFRNRGPMGRGVLTDMGPSVVIDTGKAEIALISRHVEPSDLNCFTAPRHRPDAEALRDAEEPHPLARRPRADGQGGRRMRRHRASAPRTTAQLTFNNVRRPIYPLDLPNR